MDEREAHRNAVLAEIANTEGWKEIARMLEDDVKFACKMTGDPCFADKDKKLPHQQYTVDMHDIGYARGIKRTAMKYLLIMSRAKTSLSQN
jgi:hypothetical protein